MPCGAPKTPTSAEEGGSRAAEPQGLKDKKKKPREGTKTQEKDSRLPPNIYYLKGMRWWRGTCSPSATNPYTNRISGVVKSTPTKKDGFEYMPCFDVPVCEGGDVHTEQTQDKRPILFV